jgi:periplasmic nitrate reductase NapD
MRRAVVETPFTRNVDRRKFINGRWVTGGSGPHSIEIASILVQARPEKLDAVAHAIEALPGTQIYSRDPKGKLVVVIEARDVGSIGETLNTISLLPHVLTAALVFHGTDDG